ncbi:MAG: hypothetical protein ACM3SX_09870 [Deltaproteobacteria bacterium]
MTAQTQARQFFEDKIVQQARAEGVVLSADERLMLKWSESAADSIADPELVERLAAQISDEDYEAKIAGLLSRCYATEIDADRGAKKAWAEAFATLNRGDHYVLVMINRALGRQLTPWWKLRLG